MDAPKSKALDSTLRLVFSLCHGILLVFCIILLYVILGESRMPSVWFLVGVLTVVSFVVAFLLNTITQYMSCGNLNGIQLASTSAIPAGITGAVIFTLYWIPFLESPVLSVLPETLTPIYKKGLSQGFYVLWAGLYGQLLASGFVQTCGKSN
jgi:hypothetical protein